MDSKDQLIKKYESLLKDIYDICLCERFETHGFDYHEQHPRRKQNNGGKRPLTPRNLIEQRIGLNGNMKSQLEFVGLGKN